jgi:hypothetical protein
MVSALSTQLCHRQPQAIFKWMVMAIFIEMCGRLHLAHELQFSGLCFHTQVLKLWYAFLLKIQSLEHCPISPRLCFCVLYWCSWFLGCTLTFECLCFRHTTSPEEPSEIFSSGLSQDCLEHWQDSAFPEGPLEARGVYPITHRPTTGLSPSDTIGLFAFPYHLHCFCLYHFSVL